MEMKMGRNHERVIILCRRTPVKGILKSRPVTPDVSASVGEKSKVSFLLLFFLKKQVTSSGASRDGAEHDQPRQKVMLYFPVQVRNAMLTIFYLPGITKGKRN